MRFIIVDLILNLRYPVNTQSTPLTERHKVKDIQRRMRLAHIKAQRLNTLCLCALVPLCLKLDGVH